MCIYSRAAADLFYTQDPAEPGLRMDDKAVVAAAADGRNARTDGRTDRHGWLGSRVCLSVCDLTAGEEEKNPVPPDVGETFCFLDGR